MLCSIIIPTINRPSLEYAVKSALDQELDPEQLEVIIVNDSGDALPDRNWLNSAQVKIVDTNRSERSRARNAGAAAASGRYLLFLDDDDLLHQGGVKALLAVAEASNCGWIYGAHDRVDRNGIQMSVNRPEIAGNISALLVAGESIHLSASIIEKDTFFQCGSFDPMLAVQEDRDMLCRLALLTDVDRTDYLVSSVKIGHQGSSSDWSKATYAGRVIREKALDSAGAKDRLRQSIGSDVHLRGRIGRSYLISTVINLSSGRFLKSASRLTGFARVAGIYVFYPDFWRGLGFRSHWHRHEKPVEEAHFEAPDQYHGLESDI